MSKKVASFEGLMQRLEDIVRDLEKGDLSLEESMKLFEEGSKLSVVLNQQLNEAEQKVTIILRENDGSLHEEPFVGEATTDDL